MVTIGKKKSKWGNTPYDPERRSATQMGMVFKCGQQYAFRYIEGRKLMPGYFLHRGRGPHAAQEANLGNKIENGTLLPLEKVLDVARDAVRSSVDESGISLTYEERQEGQEKVVSRAVDDAVRASELHHGEVAPNIDPVAVEKRVDFTVHGVKMMAFLDVEEKGGGVLDTKVVSKKPAVNAADNSDQLAIYALAQRSATGTRSPRQRLDHLVLRSKDVEYAPREREVPATEEVVSRRIAAADAAIRAGNFLPAAEGSWFCSAKWCGYHPICPFVRKPKSVVVG